jgi:hypothetical protein
MEGLSAVPGMGQVAGVLPGGVPSVVDRQSRRLYVGNIPAGITETEIQEFFNTAMIAAKAASRFASPHPYNLRSDEVLLNPLNFMHFLMWDYMLSCF